MAKEYKTEEELLEKTSYIINTTVGDHDISDELANKNNKGRIGHIIEKGFYGYNINSDQAPDFENLGIELKVTGYKWVNNGKKVSAKERLVITLIDYYKEIEKDFYNSSCYKKLDKILFLFYEYESTKHVRDYLFTNYLMYHFNRIPEKDQLIIQNDWQTIIDKIKDGKAHELSEGDTFYLGACPKGANKNSVRAQPFSDILAMQRAFSLKSTYMTYLLRTQVFHEVESKESFIKDLNKLRTKSLKDIIAEVFVPYQGKTLTELDTIFAEEINRKNSKQYLRSYTSRMMKISDGNLDYLEEFQKANIQIKTIRIERNGSIKESMSFPTFDFKTLAQEMWEESELFDFFSATKFLFVIYDEIDDAKKEYRFRGIKLWNMPIDDLEIHVRQVWEKTNAILNGDLILNIKNNRVLNNFPNASENPVSHVRPHGQNRNDTKALPESTKIVIESNDGSVDMTPFVANHVFTKQCFWLNNDYVAKVLTEE